MAKVKRTCNKCQKTFLEKDIYTIQQFQYRPMPDYTWSLQYFEKAGIDEWSPFCQDCMSTLKQESYDAYLKKNNPYKF